MHRVDHVHVDGFWGNHQIDTPIFPEVTFIIGVNGSGKTTFINLVAAILNCDFVALDQLPFERASIVLASPRSSKKPVITVTKEQNKELPYYHVRYEVRPAKSAKPVEYSLGTVAERYFLHRDVREGHRRYLRDRVQNPELQEEIKRFIQLSWLSVHRTPLLDRTGDDTRSPIDQKLYQLEQQFARYLSQLNGRKDVAVSRFQEYVFLSLIEGRPNVPMFEAYDDARLSSVRESLEEIFREFKVNKRRYSRQLSSFFEKAATLSEIFKHESKTSVSVDDAWTFFGLHRIGGIIGQWNLLQTELQEIYRDKNRFVSIVNGLLQRKQMEITDSNELAFLTTSDKQLNVRMLSSGEKQLIILLGEALIQRNEPYVYIADEPELSLHVNWQEKLVHSIRALSVKSQLIFATHSPDVIAGLNENVIDMEKIIR